MAMRGLPSCTHGNKGLTLVLIATGGLTLLGATALETKWYLCMALTHWQMDVQALETLEMASGVKSSLSMYG